MSPLTQDMFANSVSSVQKYLKLLELFRNHDWQEIQNDIMLKGAYERYVYLLLQSTLDLAEAIISLKKLRKPSSYGESFEILVESGIITIELQDSLRILAKLRNAMTHDYDYLKPEWLEGVLQNGYKDIEKFTVVAQGL